MGFVFVENVDAKREYAPLLLQLVTVALDIFIVLGSAASNQTTQEVPFDGLYVGYGVTKKEVILFIYSLFLVKMFLK